MPKRIVDGDALWRSDKLAQVEPAWMRAEFANLIPLALANGSFECNPRLIWARVYAYNRPQVTLEDVQEILGELERVGLLVRWDDAGKTWGYWVGIDKPGRLPAASRQHKNHEATGPTPPPNLLQSMASQRLANGCVGIGIGTCIGIGKGIGTGPTNNPKINPAQISEKATTTAKAKPTPTAKSLNSEIRALARAKAVPKMGEPTEDELHKRRELLKAQAKELEARGIQ